MVANDITSDQARRDARVERRRRAVDALVEVGMNLVRTLDPANGPAAVRDPFQAYCRISRALRLTLMLEARLSALADEGAVAMAAERRLAEASAEDAEGESEAADLETERGERVGGAERERQDPDEVGRFMSRPMAEVAAMVCHEFGLAAAQAGEVQAAFTYLIANDDACTPDPSGPGLAAFVEAGGRDIPRRTARRSGTPPGTPLGRWPP